MTEPIITPNVSYLNYFTTPPEEYHWVEQYFAKHSLGRTFYASFLNSVCRQAQKFIRNQRIWVSTSRVHFDAKEYALLAIFDEVPTNTQGLIDAMDEYRIHDWMDGIPNGLISIVSKDDDISVEQINLAQRFIWTAIFTVEKRRRFIEEGVVAHLAWATHDAAKSRTQRRMSRKHTAGTVGQSGDMSLGERETVES